LSLIFSQKGLKLNLRTMCSVAKSLAFSVQAMGGWLVWLYYLDPMAWSLYGVVGSQLGDIDNEFISYADGTTVTIKEFTRLAGNRSLIPYTKNKGDLRIFRTSELSAREQQKWTSSYAVRMGAQSPLHQVDRQRLLFRFLHKFEGELFVGTLAAQCIRLVLETRLSGVRQSPPGFTR
jgi:hypothetical protein